MVTSTATLPSQGQAEGIGEGELPRAAGSLLKDSRRARKLVLEGQVNAKTEPAESPMNEQSEAMPSAVQVGEDDRQSVYATTLCLNPTFSPTLAALTFID